MKTQGAAAEWRTGWPYVAVTHIGTLGSIFLTFGIGQFMTPLSQAFGWSRAEISAPMFISSVCTILFATALGGLVDRVGPRRILLTGVPLACLAIASVGLTGPSIWGWYAAWSVYCVFALALGPITYTVAVVRHFNVSRGLAMSIGYSASGVGGAMWPPLTFWLISELGWRGAFMAVGAGIALVVIPVAFLLFRGPVTGPREAAVDAPAAAPPLAGLTLREALSSTVFWRVGLVLMVTAAAASSTSIHLPSMLTDKGVSPLQAAATAAVIGPALIIGRISCGWLLDVLSARIVASGYFALAVVGCGLLIGYDGDQTRAVIAAVLIGLTMGAEGDLLAFLISRYCGLRSFGAIYGVGLTVFSIGYGMGPTASGALFDRLGNYDLGFTLLTGLLVVCVGVALTLGKYPDFSANATAEPEPQRTT